MPSYTLLKTIEASQVPATADTTATAAFTAFLGKGNSWLVCLNGGFIVGTSRGQVHAKPGDYVCKCASGLFYVMNAENFEQFWKLK